MASKPGPGSGKRWRPDSWPAWRKEASRILRTEGPQPLMDLVSRLSDLVPPDQGLHKRQDSAKLAGVKQNRTSIEQQTRTGQREVVFATLHSALQTGFYERWVSDDDVTMIDLGPVGRKYYEERDAQSHQPAPVQRSREGTD